MIKLNRILFIFFILFSSCSNKSNIIDECRYLKRGDTIIAKEFYIVKKYIVLTNYYEKEFIEVRDIKYNWDIKILPYDCILFKEY